MKKLLVTLLTGLILLSSGGTALAQSKVSVKPVEPFYQKLDQNAPKQYESETTYLSPLKEAPISFSSLAAAWQQDLPENTTAEIEVRFKNKSGITDWYHLDADPDYQDPDPTKAVALIVTNKSTHFQYKIHLETRDSTQTPVVENLEFTFISGGSPKDKMLLASSSLSKYATKSDTQFEAHDDIPDHINSDAILGKPKVRRSVVELEGLTAEAEQINILPESERQKILDNRRRTVTYSTPSLNTGLNIISRASWGANEALRVIDPEIVTDPVLVKFEDDYYTKFANELKVARKITTNPQGEELTWPITYPEKVSKIIVHHTATTKHLDDPKRAIRDIYYWHTVSKGWGDIGYNYIIDQQGNIYEGRYGGEAVVGAHAGRGNHGSIGIAVLGEYDQTDPPQPVIDSLTALIKEKTQQYGIDPTSATTFRGENYPNIMGHRDIGKTACPGEKLYNLLPVIRQMAKADYNPVKSQGSTSNSEYDLEYAKAPNIIKYTPGSRKNLSFQIKNTGSKSWGAATYFQISNDSTSRSFLSNAASLRSESLGQEVKPGESITISFNTQSQKTSGSGLIQFYPMLNGSQKIERYLSFPIQVQTPPPKPRYEYELESIILSKNDYKPGDRITATVRIRNLGVTPWQNVGINRTTLGADNPRDHLNQLLDPPSARLAEMNETLVKYNQIATFQVPITVPNKDGTYREYFTPVIEGITWLNNHDTYLEIRVGDGGPVVTTQNTVGSPVISNGNIATDQLNASTILRPIRIDLSYRGNPAIITGSGKFVLYEGKRRVQTFDANQKVTVKYDNGTFALTSGSDSWEFRARPRFVPLVGTIMRIDNWERRNSWGAQENNNEFRGTLEVLIYDNELHVVNELPLEQYMKGIAEVGPDSPEEKIKTIMVIARTYARFYMEAAQKFPGAPFDLNDDPNYSQKYMGYSFEKRSPKTAQMAAATAGEYVTYQNRLIKTPYFSRSNGQTISASEKWGWTDAPWLQSVDDSHCNSTEFWGHGVGLSGCGATALANQGKSYQEIIKYYYRGVEITKTQ